MHETVNSFNIAYILYTAFEALRSVVFGGSAIPRFVTIVAQDVVIIGITTTLVLLALIVYTRIRLVQVEHTGFHHKEEEERRRHEIATHTGVNSRWDMVVALASSDNDSDWRRAIMEADVLLATALTERGIPGDTVGDQLKNANRLQFTTLDLAWEAHKMRNTIAHLGEAFPLTQRDTQATIDLYRRVFEEFGVV